VSADHMSGSVRTDASVVEGDAGTAVLNGESLTASPAGESRSRLGINLGTRLRTARFVATYWRDAYMAMDGPARVGSHGLAMVLAALDGETDPVQLGIAPDSAAEYGEAGVQRPGPTVSTFEPPRVAGASSRVESIAPGLPA